VPHEPTNADGAFAGYLAKRLIGDKRFQAGVPEEAAELGKRSDIALFKADLGLQMSCLLDREADPGKMFSFSRQELFEIGKACLKYTGTVNGAKMPVGITLYEVGAGPTSEDDRTRLRSLHKNFAFAKVALTTFYIDVRSRNVWSPGAFNGLLRGRRWIERVLREPRKHDGEIFVADAVLPAKKRQPIATIAILALLVAVFIVEQIAKVGDKGAGLLGVDVGTLFALGAMNSDAVSKDGEWYRLFSAALLHADALHLLFNGVALGLAGYLLESLVGRAWLLGLFLVGAAGGSLMGLVINPANIVSVGASGAVMGLLAAALVLAMRFPAGAKRVQVQLRLLQFLIPSLIPLATSRQEGRIDFAAHFGGAIVGLVAGYTLFAIWPKNEEEPRFPMVAKGLGAITVLVFGLSVVFVKGHYAAHAGEAAFTAADFLVDDAQIPKDSTVARNEVDTWGSGHPRDPRVRFFRALRLLDEGNTVAAEVELRGALGEREILTQAFGNKKLETGIRSVLCELLLVQGKRDEARHEAQPVCKAENGSVPEELQKLGVCD